MQPDQLIRDLIETGILNEETRADLERLGAEHAAGTLHPDDAAYIEALHARLTNAPLPDPEAEEVSARLDGLTLEQWRERALKAEAELAAIRDLQAGSST